MILDVFLWLIIIGSPVGILVLVARYRQTKRPINLAMILPMFYTLIVYLSIAFDWVPHGASYVRVLVLLFVWSIIINITVEYISYRIIKRKIDIND